ncbi:putative nitrogen fixation protein NifT [Wolinella succinogenes]|uniref:Nitrogen fixation protein NifT n=1 Tax=Wolinella succinogenes (strain ATCC 29543 / DSM 1740 / CCUG 13145 / JCM 31913 / LMG 7466 / NCTC 11488 / FDC 602W) TaxID=273121 RepID=Q7MRF3_WOLSU|nr:putative nitrogen fixation protein NifT [Wolinella succinogenes]NLU35113.1 putative nitrogen fixation protein NifT [Wolinella succinogenes]CAE10466.1 hypothetical protein WS1400 [Wolinella succinogenes]VEG80609.1 Nitrogen fixation protein [Wolinella succinogenes]HCZ19695.1 putative nitrogen fixation protein NifT [Helicobacter sp.]
MAKVMLTQRGEEIKFYIAKKDMEEVIESVEIDGETYGGEVLLKNGDRWYFDPIPKKFPADVVAKRVGE